MEGIRRLIFMEWTLIIVGVVSILIRFFNRLVFIF